VAEYKVNTGLLSEAGDNISTLITELRRYEERIASVVMRLPEGTIAIKRQLDLSREKMSDLCRNSKNLGRTLYEIADVYSRAEQNSSFDEYRNKNTPGTKLKKPVLPKIRNSTGSIMFNNTILPNWLQMAVLEYEQTRM